MPLLKDGQIVDDSWTLLDAETPLAEEGDLIVTLEQWQTEGDRLRNRNGRLGLRLESDQSPAEVAGDLEHFAMIALNFPRFGDGRAYSYARLLRERYGFTGELRAVGNVLRDQALFMLRCGFDAFDVADDSAVAAWQGAVKEFTVFYQPTGDRRRPASVLRRGAAGKAG